MSAQDFDFEKWLEEKTFTSLGSDEIGFTDCVESDEVRALYALLSEARKQAFIAGAGYAIRSEMGSDDKDAERYAKANKYGIAEWWDEFSKKGWTPVELPKEEV